MERKLKSTTIRVPYTIDEEFISDLIETASYGMGYFDYDIDPTNNVAEERDYYTEKCASQLFNGGKIILTDNEDDNEYPIDLKAFCKGIEKFAKEDADAFARVIAHDGSEDAFDCWNCIQVIMFGEIIYG